MSNTKNFDDRIWANLGERGSLLAGEGWAFASPDGRVRHKISDTDAPVAYCGYRPRRGDWAGTGSQEEYEKLASLPKCVRCMERGA